MPETLTFTDRHAGEIEDDPDDLENYSDDESYAHCEESNGDATNDDDESSVGDDGSDGDDDDDNDGDEVSLAGNDPPGVPEGPG